MPGVTGNGWPFHAEQDSVQAWALTSQQLAERLDGLWSALGLTGKRVVSGSVVLTVSASGGVTVNLPAGFASAPHVVAVLGDESANVAYLQLVASAATASSFAVRAKKSDGSTWTGGGGIRINYVAIGAAA